MVCIMYMDTPHVQNLIKSEKDKLVKKQSRNKYAVNKIASIIIERSDRLIIIQT